jgi:nickel/cobalt exporter
MRCGLLIMFGRTLLSLARAAFVAFLAAGLWAAASVTVHAQTTPTPEQAPRAAWPSTGPSAPSQPSAAASRPSDSGNWLLDIQRKLQGDLAVAVRGVKGEHAWPAIAMLVGLSFLYGVFHAAGPGHGKAVISSYVVANRTTLRRGIILSFISSLVQAFSAIGLVSVLVIGMNAASLEIRQTVQQFEIASAAFIVLAGLWLFFAQLRRYVRPFRASAVAAEAGGAFLAATGAHHHHHSHDHGHHHGSHGESCGCGQAHMPSSKDIEGARSFRQAAAIVLAVGIRPCTGAILVLVFALTQGMFWAGVASTFAMALGTAITVSALAVVAVGSRETAARIAGSAWADRIYGAAGFAGALFVVLFGGVLLYGAIYRPMPF